MLPGQALEAAAATGKLSPLRRAWQRTVSFAIAFFDADDYERMDPLAEVAARDPAAAAQFVKVVMRFGVFGGLLVAAACIAFLAFFWARCGACDRPFRWWLLAHAVLQLLQVPVRAVFLAKLRATERSGGSVEQCVASLTRSPAWRASRVVSFVTYAWFVLGVVWVMNAGPCAACPGINRLMAGVILQTLFRVLVALVFSRALFLQVVPPVEQAHKTEAADPADVAALPSLTFSEELFPEAMSCAICLCEFEGGAQLRRLPCGHHFHRDCVGTWLGRSKRCPLCMGAIDAEGCGHRHQEAAERGHPIPMHRARGL